MSVEALEEWANGHKGRYVRDLGKDDSYGATCWSLVLGNVDLRSQEGWAKTSRWNRQAEIFASEANFFEFEGDPPPNVVFVEDGNEMDDWPGLGRVIEAAIKRANELDF